MALTDKITEVANSIRQKTRKTALMTLDEMPNEIQSIITEPKLQNKEVTIAENTTTTIQADEGYDGLNQVSVVTNIPTSSGGTTINGIEEKYCLVGDEQGISAGDFVYDTGLIKLKSGYTSIGQFSGQHTPTMINKNICYAKHRIYSGGNYNRYNLYYIDDSGNVTIVKSNTEYPTDYLLEYYGADTTITFPNYSAGDVSQSYYYKSTIVLDDNHFVDIIYVEASVTETDSEGVATTVKHKKHFAYLFEVLEDHNISVVNVLPIDYANDVTDVATHIAVTEIGNGNYLLLGQQSSNPVYAIINISNYELSLVSEMKTYIPSFTSGYIATIQAINSNLIAYIYYNSTYSGYVGLLYLDDNYNLTSLSTIQIKGDSAVTTTNTIRGGNSRMVLMDDYLIVSIPHSGTSGRLSNYHTLLSFGYNVDGKNSTLSLIDTLTYKTTYGSSIAYGVAYPISIKDNIFTLAGFYSNGSGTGTTYYSQLVTNMQIHLIEVIDGIFKMLSSYADNVSPYNSMTVINSFINEIGNDMYFTTGSTNTTYYYLCYGTYKKLGKYIYKAKQTNTIYGIATQSGNYNDKITVIRPNE